MLNKLTSRKVGMLLPVLPLFSKSGSDKVLIINYLINRKKKAEVEVRLKRMKN